MATYILTWNPKKWAWPEESYEKEVAATKKGRLLASRWSCGRTKSILPGDRVFLLRQHTQRGIIGSGYATSKVFEDEHWDPSGKSRTALYVEYQSDTLLPVDQRLPMDQLEVANLGVHWNNLMASGISVAEEQSLRLQRLWEQHLVNVGRGNLKPIKCHEEAPTRTYVEGATERVIVDAYERNPKAREDCIAYYGPTCAVCGFNFGAVYGELGQGYIHVHHLRDLAAIGRSYRIDPVKGLRPVCANCHAMLHQTRPPMSIQKLRRIVKQHEGER